MDRVQWPTPATARCVHLATALEIGHDLEGLGTYDGRMSALAETFGLVVLAPQ